VAFHIHQDDLEAFCGSLATVASSPDAVLIFDARLSDVPVRYTSRGWGWPLELYTALLKPLELVKVHNAKPYKGVEGCVAANLEFRSKPGRRRMPLARSCGISPTISRHATR
jgi:hypothetical protein